MLTRNQLITAVNAIISIAIMAFVLYAVGIDQVIDHILGVNLFLIFLSVLILFLMYLIMSYRIKLLLEELKISIGWMPVIRSHWIGMLLADFTPARSGYFATAASLHYTYKVPNDKALLSIFGPQMFDFALKVLAGTAGVILLISKFLKPGEGQILYVAAGAIFLVVILMLLIMFSSRFLALFFFTERLPLIGGFAKHVFDLLKRMQESSHVVIKKTPQLLVLLIFSWSMKAVSWYLVAKALGITIQGIDFPEVFFYFFFQPLITMLEFLPSPTIAGVGLSEGGSALVLSLFGVSPALATSFALLARVKTIIFNLIAVPDSLKVISHTFDVKEH